MKTWVIKFNNIILFTALDSRLPIRAYCRASEPYILKPILAGFSKITPAVPSSLTGQWSGGVKSHPWPATPTQLTATPTQPSATSPLTTALWPPNDHRRRRRRKRRSRSKLLPPTRQTLLTTERTGSSRGPCHHSRSSHSSCRYSSSSRWRQ